MPIESIEFAKNTESNLSTSTNVAEKVGIMAGALVASFGIVATVAEAKPYEPPEVQAEKAWNAEVKELKTARIFSKLEPDETRRCRAQLELEPRSYSSCIYPKKFESSQRRAEKSVKLAKWVASHSLAQPGCEKQKDRKVLYLKNKPTEYKEMIQEGQAGVFYKSPATWLWREVNQNECSGTWNCDTNNSYYGGLQMDSDFERTYNRVALRLWGHANNWPKNSQILAADRAYHGFWRIRARGLGPWPSSNAEFGTYPVPVHRITKSLDNQNPETKNM